MKKNSKKELAAAVAEAGRAMTALAEPLRAFAAGPRRRPQPIATASTTEALALSRKAFYLILSGAPRTVVSASGQRVRTGQYASGLLDAAGRNATKIDDARRALVVAIKAAGAGNALAPEPEAPRVSNPRPPAKVVVARAAAEPNSLGTRLLLLLRDHGPGRVCVMTSQLRALPNSVSERLSAFQGQGLVAKVAGRRGYWQITDEGRATL